MLIYDVKIYQERFLEVFFDALVTAKVSVEHSYVCLLLSVDGLRHRMLQDLPLHRTSEQVDFHLSAEQYFEERMNVLQGILHIHTPLVLLLTKCRHIFESQR